MPYDPRPIDAREMLTVHVVGHGDDPDRVLELGRPSGGVVSVRETVGGLAPREYTERCDALRERFAALHRDRRRVSAERYLIERWLDGTA